jgi:acyl-CoA synthetase (AMP-forming)/AMP-acid ligase II
VEEVLNSYPKIQEACVIAVPDEEFGQQPFACCVLKEGETCTPEELMEFCRERIASFKRPRGVTFIHELPRNPMGKVLRKKLREQYGNS